MAMKRWHELTEEEDISIHYLIINKQIAMRKEADSRESDKDLWESLDEGDKKRLREYISELRQDADNLELAWEVLAAVRAKGTRNANAQTVIVRGELMVK